MEAANRGAKEADSGPSPLALAFRLNRELINMHARNSLLNSIIFLFVNFTSSITQKRFLYSLEDLVRWMNYLRHLP